MPELLDSKVVGELLGGVTPDTALRWARTGVIPPPSVEVGRKFKRWSRTDLESFVSKMKKEQAGGLQ